MRNPSPSSGLRHAADQVTEAAQRIREQAADLLSRSDEESDHESQVAADTLARVSDSLEAVAESARSTGLALRDRGRDAAKAVARGERVIRESGMPGAAVSLAVRARRHARAIALAGAGAGILALLVVLQRSRNGG